MSKENTISSSPQTVKTQETDHPKEMKEDVMSSVAFTLMQLISENHSKQNFKAKLKSQSKQIFSSRNLPKISISDYLYRIMKYTKVEESTLIIALIYIDRFCKNKKVILTEYNVHRLLLASVVVAIKFNEDKYYKNLFYSKIGGIEVEEMNQLEIDFLIFLNFNLFVEHEVYGKYFRNLCNW